MATSTVPILLTGGTTMLADYMAGHGVQYKTALATGIAAGIFALLEELDAPLITGVAWIAFVTSLITTHANGVNPVTTFAATWNKIGT